MKIESKYLPLKYLKNYILKSPRGTVVFDIDDTVIKHDGSKLSKPMLELVASALKLHRVVFITARFDRFRDQTIEELKKHGFWKEGVQLLMHPDDLPRDDKTTARVKLQHRIELALKNHTIILNVGDRFSDLAADTPPNDARNKFLVYALSHDPALISAKLPELI